MSTYSKDHPFFAKLSKKLCLNQTGSKKQTYHFELDIRQSEIAYTCGDSVGIYAKNDSAIVDRIIQALKLDPLAQVTLLKTQEMLSLKDALSSKCVLSGPTPNFLKWMSQWVEDDKEKEFLLDMLLPSNADLLKDYLTQREYIDLAEEFKSLKTDPQSYVSQLRRLMPRLYSIASSPCAYPNSIHLTIDVISYISNNRQRKGLASSFLAERVPLDEPCVPVFLAPSHFRLPEDIHTDIIMVGPGTGVAPFRGFLQERVAKQSMGKNWLFFGAQSEKTDYLYKQEWDILLENKQLTHLSLAFSRDQDEKIYVQHKMHEMGKTLWEWIENGAYFYVCGDAKNMAKDVDAMLHRIIEEQSGMDSQATKDYVKNLKKMARYQRDVY